VTVDEAQEAPDVLLDTFLVNSTTTIVLFYSGASYSFISAAYVEKHNIPVAMLMCCMVVSSLGGDMPASVFEGENYFNRVEFSVNLIVLDSNGIDVILGMDWVSKKNAFIDCVKKSVKLTMEAGQEIEYVAEPLIKHKGATNQIKLNQLEVEQSQDIPVVNEYPDVFWKSYQVCCQIIELNS
jgi:hypothetical protein